MINLNHRWLGLTFLLLSVLSGCKKDQGPTSPSIAAPVVSNAVVVLDPTTYHLMSDSTQADSGIYIFQFSGQQPNIKVNSIIIGTDSGGFLRKVNRTSFMGNTMTLTTDQATLEDVFVGGSFEFVADFSNPLMSKVEGNPRFGKTNAREVTQRLNDFGFEYTFSNDALLNTGPLKITILSGQVRFFPHPHFSFRGGGDIVPNILFDHAELTATAIVKAEVTPGRTFSGEVPLATYKKHFIQFVDFVPIFYEIIVDLTATSEVTTEASVVDVFGCNFTDDISASAVRSGGQWSTTFEHHPSHSYSQISFGVEKASLSAKVSIIPTVSLRVEKLLTAYVKPKPYLLATENVSVPRLDWDHKLDAGLDVTIGFKGGIFSRKPWFDLSRDFPGTRVNLWQEPKNLKYISGDNQTGSAGSQLPLPLEVQVLDSQDNPVSSVNVYYEVISGGGSVTTATAITDAQGMAQAYWTLGSGTGIQLVKASVKDGSNSDISGSPYEFHANLNDCGLDGTYTNHEGGSPGSKFTVSNGVLTGIGAWGSGVSPIFGTVSASGYVTAKVTTNCADITFTGQIAISSSCVATLTGTWAQPACGGGTAGTGAWTASRP